MSIGSLLFAPIVPLVYLLGAAAIAAALITIDGVRRRRAGKLTMRWLLIPLLAVALLGTAVNPGFVTMVEGAQTTQSGDEYVSDFDVYFVVDTTSSMVAEDWDDNKPRLDGVKADISSIVEQYSSARFALITFDSTPVLRVPMTTDSASVISSASTMRQEATASSRGSSVGIATQFLSKTLAQNQKEDRNVLVFFFSDGENTADIPQDTFLPAKPYISSGAVLGYGTAEGGKMQTRDIYGEPSGEYITSSSGEIGVSTIDEDNLRLIADELGVEYIHRTVDTPLNVQANTADSAIGNVQNVTPKTNQLYWVFAVAAGMILLFMLFFSLREARKLTLGLGRKGHKNA